MFNEAVVVGGVVHWLVEQYVVIYDVGTATVGWINFPKRYDLIGTRIPARVDSRREASPVWPLPWLHGVLVGDVVGGRPLVTARQGGHLAGVDVSIGGAVARGRMRTWRSSSSGSTTTS